jgi:hypothetical protein
MILIKFNKVINKYMYNVSINIKTKSLKLFFTAEVSETIITFWKLNMVLFF